MTDSGYLNIRKLRDLDIPIIKEWLNKEYIRRWYGDSTEWLNEIINRNRKYYWINHYTIEYNDEPIGFCQYYDCNKTEKGYAWDNEPERTFGIDYLIGCEEFLGKGFGNQIVDKLIQIVVNKENPVQIIADPLEGNIASIKVLEKNCFYFDTLTGLYKLKIVTTSN